SLIENTMGQMQTFLYTRGYLNSDVDVNLVKRNKLILIKYLVEERRPHRIDSIIYSIPDPAMDSLVSKNLKNSFIKKGDIFDQDKLVNERQRIEELFQDNGYYNFDRQYIMFSVDTSILGNYKTAIRISVLNPDRSNVHKIFKIDSVVFTTDVTSAPINFKRFSESYNGITYRYIRNTFSEKILDRRVFIFPEKVYSRTNTIETQRQLLNLDNFKFVNINYDTTGGAFIANIFASPLNKFQTTNEVGLEVTQGFPGPFYNLVFKTRNVFGGLENLEISGRIGYEGVASAADPTQIYSSTEAGGMLNLIIPQFVLPISNKMKSRLGQYNPKTSLSTGYTYTNRPEYRRNNFNSRITYSWQRGQKRFFNASFADISLIRSVLDNAFDRQLEDLRKEGNNLWRTFEPSLVLSSSFSLTNNYNQYGLGFSKSAAFWKNYIEDGGSILNLFQINFRDSTGLELYKYFKFSTDYRKYMTVTDQTQFAFRANFGFAKSYAENKVLPYEKYFFAGGSNSNRAWRPRRLGPGSFFPSDTSGTMYSDKYEQPGELLMETSAEIRTHLFKFIQGALFIDAGNVWMLEKDENRPGAEFNINNFYREIAVGAGLGLRFDFTFLLLRFDLGFKIYNPALPKDIRFLGDQLSEDTDGFFEKYGFYYSSLPKPAIFNLAIGYPF
ncbi:MAG TPA: BamA/TamA family outer membrane protein, partial [Cyclobacteriaceae bacterium]|nr:BamA/TamA family outer membrane protein [Cyclobacteriaceae bacterium]